MRQKNAGKGMRKEKQSILCTSAQLRPCREKRKDCLSQGLGMLDHSGNSRILSGACLGPGRNQQDGWEGLKMQRAGLGFSVDTGPSPLSLTSPGVGSQIPNIKNVSIN